MSSFENKFDLIIYIHTNFAILFPPLWVELKLDITMKLNVFY